MGVLSVASIKYMHFIVMRVMKAVGIYHLWRYGEEVSSRGDKSQMQLTWAHPEIFEF